MKKAYLPLFILPLTAGFFSWRPSEPRSPQLVFKVRPNRPREAVKLLAFSSDGKKLAVALSGGGKPDWWPRFNAVSVLDATSNFVPQWQWRGYKDGRLLSFSRQDSALLLDGNVGLWEAKTGKVRWDQPTRDSDYACTTVSPDGKWVASNYNLLLPMDQKSVNARNRKRGSVRMGNRVYIYKIRIKKPGSPTLTAIKSLDLPSLGVLSTFSFSPTGDKFVLPSGDTRGVHLDLYDTSTWKLTKSLSDWKPGPSDEITDPLKNYPGHIYARWSPNGRFLVSVWYTAWGDCGVNLWSVRDGQQTSELSIPLNGDAISTQYEVQNDGSLISWGKDGSVYRSQGANLNFQSRPLLSLPNQPITAAALSPDGTTLAVGTGKGAYILPMK